VEIKLIREEKMLLQKDSRTFPFSGTYNTSMQI